MINECEPNNRIKIRKINVDYTESQPKCKTCIHRNTNTIAALHANWCKLNEFTVVKSAVCNLWQNAKGETLE